ncbi:MAG: DUF167 domain-containing protein [Thermoguttaceae bacterium]
MIDLEERQDGVILPVKVHAGARRNEVGGVQNGMLKVSVTQAPEKGKANKAIVGLLAKELSLRKAQIELVGGETSPQKRFLVRGLAVGDLRERLGPLVGG